MTEHDTTPRTFAAEMATVEQHAITAREAGDFERAALLFATAAELADDLRTHLHLQVRQACCLLSIERHDETMALATAVADQSRAEGFLPELADALSLMVDHHIRNGRIAEAMQLLSEATYTLESMPVEPESYQVVHNMAVTYQNCGFVPAALELHDRALRLATNDSERQYVYASMAAAYNYAWIHEPDPDQRDRYLHDGLYAATAALDPAGPHDVMRMATALAHRSMMLAAIGHHHAALTDADAARAIGRRHGMREEQVIAMVGEAMARWGAHLDASVIDLIATTRALAAEINASEFLTPLRELEVDVLWTMGHHDEARAALECHRAGTTRRLHDETHARWERVRLGVDHLHMEALSESDPLTGLPNRRHLAHALTDVLGDHPPVCVGVIDLDGFKQINDHYGYLQGDAVLQEFAGILERTCRRGDSVARLGGDEFVMLLRETSPGDARVVFERLRQLIAQRTWHAIPPEVRLTASVGVAVGNGAAESSRVLADAVDALHVAKRSGRDQIAFR